MNSRKLLKVMSVVLCGSLILSMALLSGCSSKSASTNSKGEKEYILIGRVNPATGPLASFGEGTPFIEEKAIEEVNKQGGIFIKEYNKKLPLKLVVVDSESNPTKASEAANNLILKSKVDLLIASSTNDTVNPVSAAAERNKIPAITMNAPGDAWLAGGPYKYAFHAFWKSTTQADAYIDAWDLQQTNKKVGLMCPNDTEGTSMAKLLKERATARGYTVVDPGRFPANTKDYTSMINQFKKENVDIIVGVMITPDFATAFNQFHQQGYVPKVLTMAKALLFPTDVAALGNNLAAGLTTEVWWSANHPFKSSITGQTSAELAQMWVDAKGKQATDPLGYSHANVELAVDALKRAQTLDRDKLREAIQATDLDTIVGHIKFDDKNFCETKLVVGQWKQGTKWPWETKIISNKLAPEVPLSSEPMTFPLPGATNK